MSNIRRKTAEHLSAAWQAPHVTQFDKADITALEEFRQRLRQARRAGRRQAHRDGDPDQGRRRGAAALPAVRLVAGHGERHRRLQEVHAASAWRWTRRTACSCRCFATWTRRRITRDCGRTRGHFAEGARQEADASTTCRAACSRSPTSAASAARRLRRSSISRKWRFSASRAGRRSRSGGTAQFVPREMLPLSLSYDHRVIDGADAARFLRFVCRGARSSRCTHGALSSNSNSELGS